MKIKLPILNQQIINKQLINQETEKEFNLDISVAAQIRFEAKFPNLAEREDLFNYSQRICEINEISVPLMISKLKMLYCWIDTDITFLEFCQLFSFTDLAFLQKLAERIKEIFTIIFGSSAEKN